MLRKVLTLIAISIGFVFTVAELGCGSKKLDAKTAGEGDTDSASGLEPEAQTDSTYPEPPRRDASSRQPIQFKVSLRKAYVLPLSEDGSCWDACSKEAKTTLVESLTKLSGDNFVSQAKALTTLMGAQGNKEVLPDIYAHVDCGYGQELMTSKTGQEDRLVAQWRGVQEILKLDPADECAVSVWDADEDGNDELIGAGIVPLIQKSNGGEVVLKGTDVDLGQVFLIELFLDQLEGEPISGGSGSTTPVTPTPQPEPTPAPNTNPYPPKVVPGGVLYSVEVVKGNFKQKKDTGEAWDAKIPFVAGGVLPDPFVQVYVNGYKSENPFMETSVANEKLYYEWREAGQAYLKDSDKLHFMVCDKDKLDNDLVGECISDPISRLSQGSEIVLRNCGQVDFIVFKIIKK